MNHLRSFYCNFFHQIWNNYFLLEAMALNCTKLEGSSYHLMLKYEKLFSGNCTQFSSQLLNCPRWGAHVSPSSPENGSMQQLLPHPNSCWRLSCTRLGKVESLGDKNSRKCTDEQPRLTHRGTERPTSVWGGESWLQVFGVAGYSRTVSLPFPGKHSQDHGGPPAAFNASLVPQTDAKATGHLPTPIPKNTTSARLLPPEQSPGAFSCCSRQ